MLSAVLYGKRTGTGFAGAKLAIGKTQGAEDVLTACVFERVAYLPDNVFEKFIEYLLDGQDTIGSLENLTFWCKWSHDNHKVEPDVLLTGSSGQHIIIEAKRYDSVAQQYPAQLARQLVASRSNGIANPILVTVGGLSDYTNKTQEKLKLGVKNELAKHGYKGDYYIYNVSWQKLYLSLEKAIDETDKPLQRLLDDVRQAYLWHGIRYKPRQWLDELSPCHIYSINYPTAIKAEKHNYNFTPVHLTHTNFPSFLGV